MKVFAIDPGTSQSGFVLYENGKILLKGVESNKCVLYRISAAPFAPLFGSKTILVIEMVASYGMPVGKTVFDTTTWIGRFLQAWMYTSYLVGRKEVKLQLCGNYKAKGPNIRQVLIDKLGPCGTKADPGPTHGVTTHVWSALALAVAFSEMVQEGTLERYRYKLEGES